MELKFSKYQGTGNDFIIIDRIADPIKTPDIFKKNRALMCNRRFGIGADGLIIIQKHDDFDFEMIYYNADGKVGSMCGNGGRCIVHYAFSKGYIGKKCRFLAIDGEHFAHASKDAISLQMKGVEEVSKIDGAYILDTGSPHYVYLSDIPADEEFLNYAKKIRYGEKFKAEGININCLKRNDLNKLEVLTYERGVEDITFSCGTGVVAAAIVQSIEEDKTGKFSYEIETKGGSLRVDGLKKEEKFIELWLTGPAIRVFNGIFSLQIENPDSQEHR